MSPVATALSTVGRAIGSFHPGAMPRLTRAHYRRELAVWFFLPVMIGVVEGGVVGVIVKNAFAGVVADRWLNIAVAIVTGAPAFANVSSFLWSSLSHGRNKITFLFGMQVAVVVLIAQAAFAPRTATGLAMIMIGVVGARICWSGVVTLRATVWHANYPRAERATLAGKLATIQAIVLASVSLIVALAMRADESAFHVIFPVAAAFGFVGALMYRRMRMRGHAALIARERESGRSHVFNPASLVRILRNDRFFRGYMATMFVFGLGNIMVTAPLIIMLKDVFGFGYLAGIAITATIPVILMPVTIPLWSRLLNRVHIIRFRAVHSWAFVTMATVVLVAAVTRSPTLIWVAAGLKGIAYGGGVLGWNLGHHDFGPADLTSQYMGVHVTLTGIRGLIGPPLAVAIYLALEEQHAGSGAWVFGVCLLLNLVGTAGFFRLMRKLG